MKNLSMLEKLRVYNHLLSKKRKKLLEIVARAKRGDKGAIRYLQKKHKLKTYTSEEIEMFQKDYVEVKKRTRKGVSRQFKLFIRKRN